MYFSVYQFAFVFLRSRLEWWFIVYFWFCLLRHWLFVTLTTFSCVSFPLFFPLSFLRWPARIFIPSFAHRMGLTIVKLTMYLWRFFFLYVYQFSNEGPLPPHMYQYLDGDQCNSTVDLFLALFLLLRGFALWCCCSLVFSFLSFGPWFFRWFNGRCWFTWLVILLTRLGTFAVT